MALSHDLTGDKHIAREVRSIRAWDHLTAAGAMPRWSVRGAATSS